MNRADGWSREEWIKFLLEIGGRCVCGVARESWNKKDNFKNTKQSHFVTKHFDAVLKLGGEKFLLEIYKPPTGELNNEMKKRFDKHYKLNHGTVSDVSDD